MFAVPLPRRAVLGAGLATVLAGCGPSARPEAQWVGGPSSAPTAPPSRPPAKALTKPAAKAAAKAGYADDVDAVLRKYLRPTKDNPAHPGYAGAVALVVEDGATTVSAAAGDAVRYSAGPVELPASKRVAMRTDAIFDLASITKVYTAMLVLRLADRGKVDLDAPVRRYLPSFTGAGKDAVTVAMLLAHTGALPVGAGRASWAEVPRIGLVKGGVPGTTFRYSSVGLMVLGKLVETLTGSTLDKAVRDQITGPLGLRDTGFKPLGWAKKSRLVATDARTSRGLLRGVVHDDVCARLGGVAGHAGLFGTAADVAVIGQVLLGGGAYRGKRLLSSEVVRRALTNVNRGKPAIDAERPGRSADHGLGVEMNQPWFMGRLAAPDSFGHTGFTGTSLLVVPSRAMVVVLLTNRAHPNWSWSNPDTHRVALANAIAA
ncbi:serine hydrolase domain-containing protein [Actinoplanes sp. NPDC051633]|uniref:serine hydrolase domain-containing protein n=1 Tax=Actinoplanes sp. NPDC051633 TaxID=3155670 RepID=UPI00341B5C79